MGFVEGENVIIAFRWAEGHYERLPTLASDLIDLHIAVLFAAGGAPSAFAAKAATPTIPIVFVASDPVRLGLVMAKTLGLTVPPGILSIADEVIE
jgi:putative ABC transport system substrate-binding protein